MNGITMLSPTLELVVYRFVAESFDDTIERNLRVFATLSEQVAINADDLVGCCAWQLSAFLVRLEELSEELGLPISEIIKEAKQVCWDDESWD